jgi:MOSC domain-containing protein YiiM
MAGNTTGRVVAVCRNAGPGLPKPIVDEVRLIEDWGVEGDYHAGKFVRHRYLAKKDPTQPNLRQVCIVDAAAFAALREHAIQIGPGMMGENITVEGVAVMLLPIGTRLSIGEALVEVTEVRIPCKQLNGIAAGLLKAVSQRQQGEKVYLAGMMARVLAGGRVHAGDMVSILATVPTASQ